MLSGIFEHPLMPPTLILQLLNNLTKVRHLMRLLQLPLQSPHILINTHQHTNKKRVPLLYQFTLKRTSLLLQSRGYFYLPELEGVV